MTELLTVKETAELLNLSQITIYRYLSRGNMPHYRFANRIRIDKQEIEAWAKGRAVGSEEASNERIRH